MKIDKEYLLKNRFWVSLIAFAPIWLVVLLVAWISMGTTFKTYAKTVADKKAAFNTLGDVRNESFTQPVIDRKAELEKEKKKVWKEAWKGQDASPGRPGLMFWPENPRFRSRGLLETSGYFGQEIPAGERSDFKEPGIYDAQLPVAGENGVAQRLRPIEPKSSWDELIHRASFKERDPTTEEIWLAQEDLWVQSELLDVVRDALVSAARFENVVNFKRVDIPKTELEKLSAPAAPAGAPPTGTTGAEEPKKPTVLRQRFRNPHWQLDLVMEHHEKSKELTATTETRLTNIDADHVNLPVAGLELEIRQPSATPPKPVPLVFAGARPDAQLPFGGTLALAKPVPLPRFAANLDDMPLEAVLVSDKADPPLPQGTVRQRFRNPNWELDLLLETDGKGQWTISDKSRITNINSTQRTLSLSTAQFAVRRLGERDIKARIVIPAEWLAWKETTDFKKPQGTFGHDRTHPEIEVEEVFTYNTAPIKRIDSIDLYTNSHRTANLALKPAAQFPPPEAPKDSTAQQPGPGMGGGLGGGALVPPGGTLGGGTPGGGGHDASKTTNGLVRNRYISVTEQVRHMPVALSLVVDQAHMQDVLTAVINSRLRIQITQVQWKRIRGVKSMGPSNGPGGGDRTTAPGVPPGGGVPGSKPGVSGGGASPPGGGGSGGRVSGGGSSTPGGGTPPGGIPGSGANTPPGGANNSAQGSGDDSDPNLVELAVYGIAALYERYPPRPPATAEGTGGATPAPTHGVPPK